MCVCVVCVVCGVCVVCVVCGVCGVCGLYLHTLGDCAEVSDQTSRSLNPNSIGQNTSHYI